MIHRKRPNFRRNVSDLCSWRGRRLCGPNCGDLCQPVSEGVEEASAGDWWVGTIGARNALAQSSLA